MALAVLQVQQRRTEAEKAREAEVTAQKAAKEAAEKAAKAEARAKEEAEARARAAVRKTQAQQERQVLVLCRRRLSV